MPDCVFWHPKILISNTTDIMEGQKHATRYSDGYEALAHRSLIFKVQCLWQLSVLHIFFLRVLVHHVMQFCRLNRCSCTLYEVIMCRSWSTLLTAVSFTSCNVHTSAAQIVLSFKLLFRQLQEVICKWALSMALRWSSLVWFYSNHAWLDFSTTRGPHPLSSHCTFQ